jgi:hypothetical protein
MSLGNSCDPREDDEDGESRSNPTNQLTSHDEDRRDLRSGDEQLRCQLDIVHILKITYPDDYRDPKLSAHE